MWQVVQRSYHLTQGEVQFEAVYGSQTFTPIFDSVEDAIEWIYHIVADEVCPPISVQYVRLSGLARINSLSLPEADRKRLLVKISAESEANNVDTSFDGLYS